MSDLQIFLFGCIQVRHFNEPSPATLSRTGQTILAYLLLHGMRSHPRELLVNLLWGDRDQGQARRCLNTALWRLRHVLEPDGIPRGTYLITTSTGEVSFNWGSNCWLDTAIFETKVSQVLGKPIETMEVADVQQLEQALQLYTGELLEGFYDDWSLRKQEFLRRLYLNSLAHLMDYYRHHALFEQSLAYGQQILERDPLREEIHRQIMRLYLESGQRALAIQQFERCSEILATELDVPPMAETQALYSQIVGAVGPSQAQPHPVEEPDNLQQALRQLQLAVQSFAAAQGQLQRTVRFVERFVERDNQQNSISNKSSQSNHL